MSPRHPPEFGFLLSSVPSLRIPPYTATCPLHLAGPPALGFFLFSYAVRFRRRSYARRVGRPWLGPARCCSLHGNAGGVVFGDGLRRGSGCPFSLRFSVEGVGPRRQVYSAVAVLYDAFVRFRTQSTYRFPSLSWAFIEYSTPRSLWCRCEMCFAAASQCVGRGTRSLVRGTGGRNPRSRALQESRFRSPRGLFRPKSVVGDRLFWVRPPLCSAV